MGYLLGFLLLLVLTALAAALFLATPPAKTARLLTLLGPLLIGAAGLILLIAGRVGVGVMVLTFALALYGRIRRTQSFYTPTGKVSTVRSAALEMQLDHDTGEMSGTVLIGSYEGEDLSGLTLPDLLLLYDELRSDDESLQLLEAYLDREFPLWRTDAHAQPGTGEGRAAPSGPIGEQEAYQILGLEPGASASDIRKAHRRLMQRVHPDVGGSSFLAARINEAKDVLLLRHR